MDAINLKNYFFYVASFVVILAGVKMSSEIVVILFLAIFISSIFSSLLKLLQKQNVGLCNKYFIKRFSYKSSYL
jgi:predicted PurR-regulated permease PerM